jgi:peroxiredoxin
MESLQMRRRVFAGIALVAVCLLSPTGAPAADTEADVRKPAPDFTLNDSKGASVRLSKYKGKVVLLNFWATWCHGCKLEIPWFTEFEHKYKHNGLAVIGVSMDEDGWKSVKPFLKEKKLNYPVVVGNEDMAKLYGGVETMPMTLLIDRGGKIAASYTGMVDKDACESEIRMLLQDRGRNADK